MKRILNLGAGTQSSVLLLMADRGDIEPLDVAVFADTGWEPEAVYKHLEWLEGECKNTKIVRVSNGNIYTDALNSSINARKGDGKRFAAMPLFIRNTDGTHMKGMLRRQCTGEYKIDPIRKYIKTEVLGLKPRARYPKTPVVTQVFGISVDEFQRMRAPDGPWVLFEYPLVKMRWVRSTTINWAREHYPDRVFPRSACIGCPFRDNKSWAEIKKDSPDEWQQAVHLDETIRHANSIPSTAYLHSSRTPLKDVDFRSSDDKNNQLNLWQDECEGMCGV